jgi:hypothetical protein
MPVKSVSLTDLLPPKLDSEDDEENGMTATRFRHECLTTECYVVSS